MLKHFEVENFRGFQYKLEFNLKAGRYDFNQEVESNGLVKNAIIYGPNGCGKSALGLALFDIILHLTDKKPFEPSQLLPYPNLNRSDEKTSFKYVFLLDGDEIIYEYTKNNPINLLWEKLTLNNECLLECDYIKKMQFIKSGLAGNLNTELIDNKLSLIKYIYRNTPTNTVPTITKLVNFCENMLWYRSLSEGNEFAGHEATALLLDDMLQRNGSLKAFKEFLKPFGLEYNLGFEIVNNQSILYAYFNNGQKAPFLSIASTGTKALYLFYCWNVFAFSNTSLLFIDEFDAFLHYEASETIIKFLNKQKHFQTILTTHNTSLLSNELSRPDCSFIMSTTTENVTQIKNLANSTDREIRKVHNLEKMYRSGAFKNEKEPL